MTWRANKSRFPKMPKPKDAKKQARIYIDPSDFNLMRHRAFLTTQQTAELLDVTHRTVLNWEKGKARIPYTAYRVLKMKVGYVFNDEHFHDWFVKGDTLWSPEGRGFKPQELRYIANYFWMARQWLAERRAMKSKPNPPLNFNISNGAASDVSPTSPGRLCQPGVAGTLTSCGAAPRHEALPELDASLSQQKRPRDFEKFLETLSNTA